MLATNVTWHGGRYCDVDSGHKYKGICVMKNWIDGYTQAELDGAQERYGLTFPPDLIALLLDRQPANGYDWRGESVEIREMLKWPFEALQFDVEHNSLWWEEWGARPATANKRSSVLKAVLHEAPKLIPLFSHRFIPEEPHQSGNPVFSMYGQDTIYYGANLDHYFDNEFNRRHVIGPTRYIRFWSDLVERNN
jgi:hypothetical protein